MSTNLRSVAQTLRSPSVPVVCGKEQILHLIETLVGLHDCEIVHHRTVSTTVPVASCRGFSWDSTSARPFITELCVHVPRLSWDSTSAKDVPRVSWDSTSATKSRRHRFRTLSIQHMSKGRPKLCWLDASRETCDTSRCGQQSNRKEQRERRGSCAQG